MRFDASPKPHCLTLGTNRFQQIQCHPEQENYGAFLPCWLFQSSHGWFWPIWWNCQLLGVAHGLLCLRSSTFQKTVSWFAFTVLFATQELCGLSSHPHLWKCLIGFLQNGIADTSKPHKALVMWTWRTLVPPSMEWHLRHLTLSIQEAFNPQWKHWAHVKIFSTHWTCQTHIPWCDASNEGPFNDNNASMGGIYFTEDVTSHKHSLGPTTNHDTTLPGYLTNSRPTGRSKGFSG